jgi:NAD(P)H-dependent flavin oxidoreductase YrpB (nitropropane dioxygenase family)
MLPTPLCDLLDIEVPVICAPFGPWDEVDLAAAVCGAGGLGSLGTAARALPDLREQWDRLRARTGCGRPGRHDPRRSRTNGRPGNAPKAPFLLARLLLDPRGHG